MLSKKPAARAEHVHPPQKVVLRDAIFEPELVEQPTLVPPLPPHHRPPPLPQIDQPPESRFVAFLKPFFDSIDPLRSSLAPRPICFLRH